MLVSTRVCPTGWYCPPITPNDILARPLMVVRLGMMVCSGLFPGAMQLGWPGCTRKPAPRFCSSTPVLLETTAEPNECAIELMKEQTLRSLSITVMYTVDGLIGGDTFGNSSNRSIFIFFA